VTSPRPTTRPWTSPLTCAVVWEREALHGVVNHRRIDGKDGASSKRQDSTKGPSLQPEGLSASSGRNGRGGGVVGESPVYRYWHESGWEQRAAAVVAAMSGATVSCNDDGSEDAMYDLALRWPDGREAAMEVTQSTDQLLKATGPASTASTQYSPPAWRDTPGPSSWTEPPNCV
jgi:hypothetical protein